MSNAKLNQLSVMGIRSFDNNEAAVIKFGTPLTLIVGTNGSGKTTIIECIKYLTTGLLPPNSKGGAFIHDPKLIAENEVLATTKLSFQSTQDKRMICSRRLQLTVKKTTRQQKSLEGNLVMYANGERTAISSRVAELDHMVPMYLGVSKSILDNVIFCHQDESLWPMSEPSVLKKKFDEIFEAMKYTRAIDNIKILRKKYNEELAQLKIIESNAKEEKSKGQKNEQRMEKLDSEMNVLRAQSHELSDRIEEAEKKYTHAQDSAAGFHEIVAALNGKRIEAKAKEDSLEDLKQHVEMMDNTDEELRTMLKKYEDRVNHFRDDISTKKDQYRELEGHIQETRDNIGQKRGEKGKLDNATENYQKQLQRREEMVKQSARSHSIRGFDEELDEDQVKAFMDRIAKMAKDQRSALDRAQKQNREDSQEVQKNLNFLQNRKDTLARDMQTTKQSISENDNKSRSIREKVHAVKVDEGRQAVLQSNVDNIEAKLRTAKTTWENGSWDKQIAEASAQVASYDRSLQALSNELIKASKATQEAGRLAQVKKELGDTRLALKKNQSTYESDLGKVLGTTLDPHNIMAVFSKVQEEKTKSWEQSDTQRNGNEKELSQIAFKLKTAQEELKTKTNEHDKLRKRVHQATQQESKEPSEFPSLLQEYEDYFEEVSTESSNYTALRQYYEGCQKYLTDRKACSLCSRPFKNEAEQSSIRKKIQDNLKKAEEGLREQNKSDVEEALKSLQQVKSAYEQWIRLRDEEVPAVQKEVDRLQAKNDELARKLDRQDIEAQKCKSAKDEVNDWSETVRDVHDLAVKISRYEEDLENLTQNKSQTTSVRSVDDIDAQTQEEREQQRNATSKHDSLRQERMDAQSNLSRFEIALRDARADLSTAAQQLKDKSALKEQVDELKRHAETLRSTVDNINNELEHLRPEIENTQHKLDTVTERGAKRESDIQNGMSDLSSTLNKLETAEQEIQTYFASNIPSQLSACERAMDSLDSDSKRLDQELKSLTSGINKLNEQERKLDQTQQQINQNIRYRSNLRSLESTRREIKDLESHNAEADREHWQREATKWQNKRNKLTADNAGVVGEMKSKDEELVRLGQDWETLYDGAGYRYREAHVKVEATKAAVQDLGNYANALDKAIMAYHSLKMDEINEIVDDLWRRTYQGTDVDTVLIRSDAEGVQRAGNKSYNYRVCMVKQDAEMDMRGRCSAGQKVLASIIIRLALAECFGTNCGVMALDEPTTNLDRDNIHALATSLNAIIKARAGTQRNFQLIVITHDEEFLKDMRAQDFCDDYWRVSRNERQKSKIEKQSMSNVW